MKKYVRFLALIFSVCMFCSFGVMANEDVNLIIDENTVEADGAGPYYDSSSGRVMVPIRLVAEYLGATVEYDETTAVITVTKGKRILKLTVGSTSANINNRTVELDCMPVVTDGVTYVPIRFLAENLDMDAEWDETTFTAKLTSKTTVGLGMTETDLKSAMGTPDRTDESEKGYIWYVYNSDYSDFTMIGIDEEKVVACYFGGVSWTLESGINCGMKLDTCNSFLTDDGYSSSSADDVSAAYTKDDQTITLYFSPNGDKNVYAALCENEKYSERSNMSAKVLSSYAYEICDMVNVLRAEEGLDALEYNETLADIARDHSSDMAKNNYFSHEGSDGSDRISRAEAGGFTDCYISEALCQSYPDAIDAFAALAADDDYQSVILANFTDIAAGVAYNSDSDGIIYCTQLFYSTKD